MVTVGADPSTATPGVAIGPYGHPMSETDGDYPITHALATTGLNVEGTGWPNRDTTTAGTRNAGEVISFPVTIRNPNVAPVPNHSVGGPATAADVYNISYVNPDSTQFSVVLFKSDGTTPLADTNGDGKPDTGALEPGADANIIVKVFIKADASDTNSNTFTINAHSSNKPSLFDPTYLLIEAVRPAGVDIAKRDTLGLDNNTSTDTATGQDDDATTAVGANAKVPGDVITFNVDIGNMRPEGQSGNAADEETSVADTYKLSFEKLAGASDFVVHLFEDANNNHTIDADELVPISDTGWLESVADVDALTLAPIFKLNVRVQVPMGTPAGTYYIRVTATSTNNSGISDTMRLAIQVKDAPAIEITPDNTATVIPGGSYIFPHVVTNTGNAESDVTMTYTFPAGTLSGYNAVWVDADGAVLGTGDSCPTGVIAAGASKNIYLKVFVPANAPSGSVVPITVKADMDSFDEADYPASVDTALDIITVIDGALQLTKSNNPTGDVIPNVTEIEYTTVYKNLSAGTLTTTYIADAIPAHTYLIDGANKITAKKPNAALSINAEDDATEFEYSTDGGATWANFSPAPTNFKEVTNIRVNIGAVPAGQSGEFVFKVKVK
jgi:hypothetical protein